MKTLLRWLHCLRYGHDVVVVKHLHILAHIRCDHCGNEWCYNRDYDSAIPWWRGAEEFFTRRLAKENT